MSFAFPSRGPELLARIRLLRDVPTLSVILSDIGAELEEKRASLDRLTTLVSQDQVLCAKVLRAANSAYFGRDKRIGDVRKALHFLGENTLRAIVFGTQSFRPEDLLVSDRFDAVEFWRYCFAVGTCAELIGRRVGYARPSELFSAGLLHDIGKLALLRLDPAAFRAAAERAKTAPSSFAAAEQALGLPGHFVVSEALGEAWHLPLLIRKLARFYHRDVAKLPTLYEELRPGVRIGTLAIAACRAARLGHWGDEAELPVPASYGAEVGLNAAALVEIVAETRDRSETMREIFKRSVLRVA